MYTAQGYLQKDVTINYLPLVKSQAKLFHRKMNYVVELDDLIQSGFIGLLDALEKFKDTGEAQFDTYAKIRINGAMIDSLRKMDLLSQDDRSLLIKIEHIKNKQEEKISYIKIAHECNISINKLHEVMQLKSYTNLLYQGEDDIQNLMESVIDKNQNIELTAIKNELKQILVKQIENLPEREKNIMGLYYQEELNLKEIATVLDLTEARISQLHNQIIKKLKMKMKEYI